MAPGSCKTNWVACLRRLSISRDDKLMRSPRLHNCRRVANAAWLSEMCTHFHLDCRLISQLNLNYHVALETWKHAQTGLFWSILAAFVFILKIPKSSLLSYMFSSFYLYIFILCFSPLKVVKESWYHKVYFLDFTEALFNLCSNSGYKNTPLVLIETNSRGDSSDTWWDFRWESSWRLGSDLKRERLCNWLQQQME